MPDVQKLAGKYMSQNITEGFCQCGCGKQTTKCAFSYAKRGMVKGEYHKYIHGHHSKGRFREKNSNWRGGECIDSRGRKLLYIPDHPRASTRGLVLEHILIAEKALGKPLPIKAVIHHIDGQNNDNGLVICQDQSYHLLLHQRMRALKACGHANWRKCNFCHQYDEPQNLEIKSDAHACHRQCRLDYLKQYRENHKINE